MDRYAATALALDPAMADFAAGARQPQAATFRVDLDDFGEGLDEFLTPWHQNVFELMGPDQVSCIDRFTPRAFQYRPETRLRERRDEQAAVVMPMCKMDLNTVFLKIDEIQTIDQNLAGDLATVIRTGCTRFKLSGFGQEGFFLSRDLGSGSGIVRRVDDCKSRMRAFHQASILCSEFCQLCHPFICLRCIIRQVPITTTPAISIRV